MQYGKMVGRTIMQHCEDPDLSSGVMHAGTVSTVLGMPGIPSLAEELILYRDLAIAESTGARYHAMHLSAARSVELFRSAKDKGLPVSCEVTSHHIALTDASVRENRFDPNYKMNPPLRSEADVAALKEGLADGTIDCLVSDHAPHSHSEKELEFAEAPFGVIGLESALAVNIRELVEPGLLSWSKLVERMSTSPARVLNLPKGTLKTDADADITIIDPEKEWVIEPERFRSKSRNCPFAGWEVKGKAVGSIVLGKIRYDDGLKFFTDPEASS
jgi:dihydroorotase